MMGRVAVWMGVGSAPQVPDDVWDGVIRTSLDSLLPYLSVDDYARATTERPCNVSTMCAPS